MSVHNLIRNAKVEVQKVRDEKRRDCALITINDQFQHQFNHKSRVSKHLETMTPEQLQSRLNNGTYFFIEDELVDWRDGMYNGFIHTDAMVDEYMDLLGYVHKKDVQFIHRTKDNNHPIALRKTWDSNSIVVPGYTQGGKFTSELSFTWNPFISFINSSFDLVRLICTNGMVGTANFLNTKIPLVNRQEEHLNIAARQIQNKVSDIVIERVQSMTHERASVGQCLAIENHVVDRMIDTVDQTEHNRLVKLLNAVSPSTQLNHVYRDSVFDNKDLAAQLPSHLRAIDIFNVVTELRTHTNESKNSSDFALDKMSNAILFNENNDYIRTNSGNVQLASFSDPDAAFFGVLEAA